MVLIAAQRIMADPCVNLRLGHISRCPLGHPASPAAPRGQPARSDGHNTARRARPDPVPAVRRVQRPMRITVGTVVRLVAHHTGHLGIDVDEMAQAMRKER
jgi:hypothetical protein